MDVLLRWKLEDGSGFVTEKVTGAKSTVDVLTDKLDEFILAGSTPTYISATALEGKDAT